MEIRYKINPMYPALETECPFGAYRVEGIPIMVGSRWCKFCPSFVDKNILTQTVLCIHPIAEETKKAINEVLE